MSRVIKFRAWGPNSKVMWDWLQIKEIANKLGWENFDQGERILMQFTGLHDVNGVEIYEGDIVRDTEEYGGGLVELKKYGWCFDSCESLHDWDCMLEVIGNIHQHPELLESKI